MLFYIVLTSISTTSGLWNNDNTRKSQQIDVNIYQCDYEHKFSTDEHSHSDYRAHQRVVQLIVFQTSV